MLGRNSYTREELDHGKAAVAAQLAGYKQLANPGDGFEALFFNNMTIVLDRYFVHRVHGTTGKDNNPLNEVELIVDSLTNNDGIMRGNNVLEYIPEESVTKLELGDPIRLTAQQFDALSAAFFADLEQKFAPR